MGYRAFTDREGRNWDIHGGSHREWEFHPIKGNPAALVRVQSPGYEKDPFEMSNEELQRLLDGGQQAKPSTHRSPFKD